MMTSQPDNNVLRTAIMRIMSEMLDDPDEHGIYPTGRFMDRIEELLKSMMVATEVLQLSGSEAVFGFVAWLTTGDEFENADTNPGYGPTQDSAYWCELVAKFNTVNSLAEPREDWSTLLTHPKMEVA